MRLCSRFFCFAILATALTGSRDLRASVAAPAGADLAAFIASSSIPGPLSINAGALARMRTELLPSLATAHTLHLDLKPVSHLSAARPHIAVPAPPEDPSISEILDRLPVGDRMRRVGRDHLNTSDGSTVDDFTICYRVNRRWGFQMIPGDPAPVKLPVSSFENSEGVTVGMVMRLSRSR